MYNLKKKNENRKENETKKLNMQIRYLNVPIHINFKIQKKNRNSSGKLKQMRNENKISLCGLRL